MFPVTCLLSIAHEPRLVDDRFGAVSKLWEPKPEKVTVGVVVAGLLDDIESVHAPALRTTRSQ